MENKLLFFPSPAAREGSLWVLQELPWVCPSSPEPSCLTLCAWLWEHPWLGSVHGAPRLF